MKTIYFYQLWRDDWHPSHHDNLNIKINKIK